MVVGSILLHFALVVVTLVFAAYLWYQKRFRYWKQRNVPAVKSWFPLGNLGGVGTKISINEASAAIYKEAEGLGYVGMMFMFQPGIILRDPELIKTILVKDFSYFQDHGIYTCEETDPLAAHTLFHKNGSDWKRLRAQLTPTFTSGSIKNMFPIMMECGQVLERALEDLFLTGVEVEVKELSARFATDTIMSCAFGVQTKTLSGEDEQVRTMGLKVFEPTFELAWKNVLSFIIPKLAALVKLSVTPQVVTDFFLGCFKDMVEYRQSNSVHRKDFLQLLIQLMEKGIVTDGESKDGSADVRKLTLNEAAAQAFVFFIAGFETSSTTIQFCIYELATKPDLQEKLFEEIQRVEEKYKGEWTYAALGEMELLDSVVSETLRKYPPLPILRICTKNYQLPGTDIIIEKGIRLLVPLLGLQNDPKYFPEPEVFNPERFRNMKSESAHHFAYLPFGEGPRHCIGARFGRLQTKIGLISFLSKYQIEMSPKTLRPLQFDPLCSILSVKGGVYVNLRLRTKI